MRSFLALPLPDPTLDALLHVQGTLPYGRHVPEDNLHLTLAFLGDAESATLETLNDLIETAPLPRATIAFDGLGTFAEMERGLVFAAVKPDDGLTLLHGILAHMARVAGADLPRRRFRPHVTLMRANRQPKGPVRDQVALALGTSLDIPGFTADRVCLYRSDLTPQGARYEVLAEYLLTG